MPKPLSILISGLIFLISITSSFSQDILNRKIKITFQSGTHEQFLDTVSKQSGVDFIYSDAINPDSIEWVLPGIYTLHAILDSLFLNQNIQYILSDQSIILSNKPIKKTEPLRKIIQGKVFSHRNEAVPYASVFFLSNSLGTLANAEGDFRIIVPEELLNDTLTIACIGYEDKLIPLAEISENFLQIKLKSAPVRIKSVIIKHQDPNELVSQSFKSRNKNYPSKPALLTAFFRESSKQDGDYISLSEALIEINKSSYTNSVEDLIRLVKGRNGTNTKKSELVNLTVEGGLYNGLRLDIAKYTSYFYSENSVDDYNYRLVKTIQTGGRETHVIAFDRKEGVDFVGYRGRLYIDAQTFALIRAEFELSPQGIEYAKSMLIRKTPREFKAFPKAAKYEVEYRFYNNCWNLYYAKSEINIEVEKTRGKQNRGYNCNFVSTAEFVITGINDSQSERIKSRESAGPGDVLVEQIANTNNLFWFDENIILPEVPLLETISKLQDEGILNPKNIETNKD